ncbi:uncharacterized protein LOC131649500 [Vicia villosa]|uniref:uncharacterized protein LOC131649500 n=1 Tax=Vicia villosa TaxID=3911 RepID=UPI00273C99CE|nr:uncharacterized protein LOC131649500 [Vicia villosa]
MSASSTHVQGTEDIPINPNEILEVTSLQMVTLDNFVAKKPGTSHARRTKQTTRRPKKAISGYTSQSSVPPSREELTKEGSSGNVIESVQVNEDMDAAVHEENVVINDDVDDAANNDDVEETFGKDDVVADDDHTEVPVVVVDDEEVPCEDDGNVSVDKDEGHTEGGQAEEKEPEKTNADKVINLDDLSDDDLVASINLSIAKRLMRRKGEQVVDEDSLKKKTVVKPTSVGPKKSWSKVVPMKRKARIIAENESDFDVALDVNDIPPKKKASTSKLAASVPEKRLALERKLAQNALECEEIVNLIHEAGLIKTVTQFSKCYEVLVKGFIVNLHEDCANKKAKDYLKVFVRGNCVNFSPTVINKFLERSNEAKPELEVSDNKMCKVITAGQVKTWPVKGKLNASKLSVKYAILHRTGAANWVPTQHKSTVSAVLGPIAFPSLIYGIILNQFPNILNDKDSVCKRASPLLFHHKLFQGTHVLDIIITSAETPHGSSKASKSAIIAMLKETCKELEARKLSLEKLTNSLECDAELVDNADEEDVDGSEEGEDVDPEGEEDEDASLEDGTEEEKEDAACGVSPGFMDTCLENATFTGLTIGSILGISSSPTKPNLLVMGALED